MSLVTNVGNIVPTGTLQKLRTEQIAASSNNPRLLFDKEPLDSLKKSIRQHGVLVPITVFQPKGQSQFSILDGERRYRCCIELQYEENINVLIPANVVDPPTRVAALLYMFSIHNFREQWELMPTALALKDVFDELDEQDNKVISKLTGLSEPQINRCKIILTFPERFQDLSLDPNPKTRIPSNFWIEAYPVLNLCEEKLPELIEERTRDGVSELLVEKYKAKKIKSVIHFRRIMDAYEFTIDNQAENQRVLQALKEYILVVDKETRAVFDAFVVDNRRALNAVSACDNFVSQIMRMKLDYSLERTEIMDALKKVQTFAQEMIEKLEGTDSPALLEEEKEE